MNAEITADLRAHALQLAAQHLQDSRAETECIVPQGPRAWFVLQTVMHGEEKVAEALKGKYVLVVEDLLNTGDTVKKVVAQVRRHGGHVIGVSAICNRGPETAESLGVPRLEALASVDFEVLDPDDCRLCQAKIPIVEDIGHGGKYKELHPDYPGRYKKLLAS